MDNNMYYHKIYGIYVVKWNKICDYIEAGWSLGNYLNFLIDECLPNDDEVFAVTFDHKRHVIFECSLVYEHHADVVSDLVQKYKSQYGGIEHLVANSNYRYKSLMKTDIDVDYEVFRVLPHQIEKIIHDGWVFDKGMDWELECCSDFKKRVPRTFFTLALHYPINVVSRAIKIKS